MKTSRSLPGWSGELDADGFPVFAIERTSPRVTPAWISPDGSFYPVPAYCHERAVPKIVAKLGIPEVETGCGLIERGWMTLDVTGRVGTRRVDARVDNEYGTQAQLDVLHDLHALCVAAGDVGIGPASVLRDAIEDFVVVEPRRSLSPTGRNQRSAT